MDRSLTQILSVNASTIELAIWIATVALCIYLFVAWKAQQHGIMLWPANAWHRTALAIAPFIIIGIFRTCLTIVDKNSERLIHFAGLLVLYGVLYRVILAIVERLPLQMNPPTPP